MASYRKAASRLNKDLHSVVRDTEALLAATGDLAGDQLSDVRARTYKSVKSLRDGMADLPGEVAEHLHDAGERAEKLIRKQPLQSMGLAVGIGLLLGVLAMIRPR